MGRRSHQDISDEQGNVSKKTEEEFKEGKTYLSIMKENLVKIEEALS